LTYGPHDLVILDDAIAIIRRNPVLYGGDAPRGARLAAAVMRDRIAHGDVPVSGDEVDGWWLITCQRDWLADSGTDQPDYWHRIVAAPEIGTESIRSEVLLTAFSKALFTIADGQLLWLVQDGSIPASLDGKIRPLLEPSFKGRAVAFAVD
jgi:hypothetical protein